MAVKEYTSVIGAVLDVMGGSLEHKGEVFASLSEIFQGNSVLRDRTLTFGDLKDFEVVSALMSGFNDVSLGQAISTVRDFGREVERDGVTVIEVDIPELEPAGQS